MNTRPDSNSADPRQIIAELRRQLAERTAERDEGLAREAANAEVLGVINSSPGDLAPVFDAILEKAHRFCAAEHGTLFLYDGEFFRLAAARGLPDGLVTEMEQPFRLSSGSPQQRLLRGERFVHAPASAFGGTRIGKAVIDAGFSTLLMLPMRRDAVLLGYITAVRREPGSFSDKHIALLENFAAQAVIAMENARLITETREALEQQTATAEVLGVINSSPGDLAPVFDAMLEKATQLCEAEIGVLWTYHGDEMEASAILGAPPRYDEFLRAGRQPLSPTHVRLRAGERVVQIANVEAHENYRSGASMARALFDLGGVRTILLVPLRKEEAVLGAFAVYRQQERPFSDKQIALLQNFAAQAVIAMENARLITETREALEQQTATAEVLGVINSSPGDLAPVFEAMLEKALRLCGGAFGGMFVNEAGTAQTVATRGFPASFAEFCQHNPFPCTPGSVIERVLGGEPVVHVLDIADDDLYRRGDPFRRAAVDLGGARTSLVVALKREGEVLGGINIYRQEVRAFSDKQIALLQNFAAQAVIAIENARLITETREALDQQTATAEVLQVINSSPGDLAPVFDAILEKAHALCGAAQGSLQIYDGEQFRAVANRGQPEPYAAILRRGFRPDVNDPFMRGSDRVLQITEAAETVAQLAPDHPRRAGVELAGARTLLFVPLRKDDLFLGRIVAARREVRPFSDKQIALLQNFAAQAVIAMENARLITETREALDQQTATAEVLGVINTSPGDLAPVFDAILEKAHSLCGVAYGTMQLFDGRHFRAVATRGLPQPLAELLRQPFVASPDSAGPRLVAGDRFHQILDMAEVVVRSSAPPPSIKMAVEAGVRTLLFLPLRKDNLLLGLISAGRREVRPFTDKEIALLENFAAQAVIAMENARLITETREALDQQTATAEVLGVINSSPGDLAPVFDAILEKAHTLCGATHGALFTRDGENFRAVATHSLPEQLAKTLREPRRGGGNALSRPLVEGADFVHIRDLAEVDHPLALAGVALAGIGTMLTVALRKDGELLGWIAAARQGVRPFTDKQIALLQSFAAQAVIAIENARLLTELRETLDRQTATADILRVIASTPEDPRRALDTIAETAARMFNATNVVLRRIEDKVLRFVGGAGPTVARIETLPDLQLDERDPATRAIVDDRQIAVDDRQLTAASEGTEIGRLHSAMYAGALRGPAVRSQAFTPLSRQGQANGVMIISRGEVRPFTSDELELMRGFADQAVIAIENARLLGELRQRTEEVADLNRGLEARVAEQVEELGRVGRLKRFLAPQLAELIVSQGDEKILESHRREIVVVFCDLRGYTAFTETAEPEEVLDFLREYHGALGPLVAQFEGTLDQFSGDGIMVFFNDPVPIPDPAERAVRMAVAMREAAGVLIAAWRERGRELGFGAGIAQGYATLGQIGFSERSGYTAIGTVCNVAARLCAEAKDGQILLGQRVNVALKGSVATEQIGALALRGLTQPVVAYNVPLVASQPALRVIEGGP